MSAQPIEVDDPAAGAAEHSRAPDLLVVLGISRGGWARLSRTLLHAGYGDVDAVGAEGDSGHAHVVWRMVDGEESTDLDRLHAEHPSARYLVMVESPVSMLVVGSGGPGVANSVQRWIESARPLLSHIQRRRHQCLVLSVPEAAADPEGVFGAIEGAFGWAARASDAHPVELRGNAVSELLAAAYLRSQPQAMALYEELLACCQPLGFGVDPVEMPQAATLDALVAGAMLDELHGLRDQLASLEADRSAQEAKDALARSAIAELRKKLDQQRLQLLAERDAASAAQQSLSVQTEKARAELEEARSEGELLLLQLLHVHEELEHYYLAWRELEQRSARYRPAFRLATGVEIGDIEPRSERPEPPHREFDFHLATAQVGQRSLSAVDLRLIEHRGRPGLVLLAGRDGSVPLSGWVQHGVEDERPFMLVVPSDNHFDLIWRTMPRSDWRFLCGLPAAIESVLEANEAVDRSWKTLCRRLASQMLELPPRLRYDDLEVAKREHDYRIVLRHVGFGERDLESLEVHWAPDAGGLQIVRPDAAGPTPLTNWPLDEAGGWAEAWQVPISPQTAQRDRIRKWDAVSVGDRAMVLALLDALPGAVDRADSVTPRLRRQSAALLQFALNDLEGGRIKRAVRRWVQPLVPVRA